ncbi:glycosyltransferase family 2 protein [Basfia succiniciproducens]|uniref:glycosyltransferase family 2 protein n=1 Tax=Basfia succiniciproducens TaxID=653940 RepID=UPI003FCE6952
MVCKTVAVVTSTIGRESLERAIRSVHTQTYPCRHYVFVDGEQFHSSAKAILDKYPHVIALYLPMNTGANGWFNSYINAAAPFLVKEDILCFLDDDNTYRPNHIQTIVDCFNAESNLDFAYSLRNFVRPDGAFVVRDDYQSLGRYVHKLVSGCTYNIHVQGKKIPVVCRFSKQNLIDVNCMALSLVCARRVANIWCERGYGNDKAVTDYLLANTKGEMTGRYTVDYTINYRDAFSTYDEFAQYLSENFAKEIAEKFLTLFSQENIDAYFGERPWAKE